MTSKSEGVGGLRHSRGRGSIVADLRGWPLKQTFCLGGCGSNVADILFCFVPLVPFHGNKNFDFFFHHSNHVHTLNIFVEIVKISFEIWNI